jgi:predicted nucleotidyltransferase
MQNMIQEAVDKIVSEYGPIEEVILFGSRARGEADEHSDTDFIVIKNTKESFVKRMVNLPTLPIQADVFVYTPDEFKAMKENENPFIMHALKNSRVIYSQISNLKIKNER